MSNDGQAVLQEAASAYRQALGSRLLAAYALGSLAHGGFSALVSDVDLGLILQDPLAGADPATIGTVAAAVRAKGSALHERLSVFWGTPSTLSGVQDGGRFPPLDRLDLLENGHLLVGSERARSALARPSAEELLIAGAEFALDQLAGLRVANDPLASMRPSGRRGSRELRDAELLVAQGLRQVTKLVLFPPRFLYTAATGRVGTNDAAADFYLKRSPGPGRELVAAAQGWRRGDHFDPAAATRLLGQQMVPLYLQYIDDHIWRLRALGQGDLVESFTRWRENLTS